MTKKIVTIFLICLIVVEIGFFFYWQTTKIVIHAQTIKDTRLADFFDSLKVVQISDLHIDRFGSRERELTSLIEKINPHLIFITGDFIKRNSGIDSALRVVERMTKGRKVIAILGNSDHRRGNQKIDTDRLITGLEKTGVHVLVNRSMRLKLGVDSVFIIGLDDNYLWKDDFFKATANLPKEAKKILLAHSPDIVTKVRLDDINLVLSGHTHGSQIRLPLVGAVYANRVCNSVFKFVSGLYHYQGTRLYVNRGIGTTSLPLRFLCKPEITIFKFEKRQ